MAPSSTIDRTWSGTSARTARRCTCRTRSRVVDFGTFMAARIASMSLTVAGVDIYGSRRPLARLHPAMSRFATSAWRAPCRGGVVGVDRVEEVEVLAATTGCSCRRRAGPRRRCRTGRAPSGHEVARLLHELDARSARPTRVRKQYAERCLVAGRRARASLILARRAEPSRGARGGSHTGSQPQRATCSAPVRASGRRTARSRTARTRRQQDRHDQA